jgi:hypothetical protein
MGHVRRGPKLLPQKLLKLREYLNVGQPEMAQMLETQIESQDKKYRVHAGRVSEYETGKREPVLLVGLAYSYLGRVSMISLADDDVSVDEFRRQLGTFDLVDRIGSDRKESRNLHRVKPKPVTLISGVH